MFSGAGFVSNLVLLRESGYFDNASETKPLLHLWSLGIEEQFYIVWPLVAWIAWKRKFNFLIIVSLVAITSFALNLRGINQSLVATFYSPQTRFWELLSGSLLAWLSLYGKNILICSGGQHASNRAIANVISWIGLLLIVVGFWVINKGLKYPGGFALVPVLGTLLLLLAGPKAWINHTILSNRLFVGVGLISYPLYLWHWPLLSFAHMLEGKVPSLAVRSSAVALSVAFAWITYKFIEEPIRNRKNNSKVLILTVLMTAVGFAGLLTYLNDGLPFRNKEIEQNLMQLKFAEKFYSNEIGRNSYPDFHGFYAYQSKIGSPTVMFLGDSLVNRLIMGLSATNTSDVFLNLSNGGCPEILGLSTPNEPNLLKDDFCAEYANYAISVAEKTESIKTIIFQFRGPVYMAAKQRSFLGGIPASNAAIENQIRKTFDRLLNKDKKIIYVYSNPEPPFNPKSCLDSRPFRLTNDAIGECSFNKIDFENQQSDYRKMMGRILLDYPKINVVDPADLFCDKVLCYTVKEKSILYVDECHLTLSGSLLMTQKILPLLGN
jgi:hypothetical protein